MTRAGRDDMATMTTIAGLVIVLLMVINMISGLFESVKQIFNCIKGGALMDIMQIVALGVLTAVPR